MKILKTIISIAAVGAMALSMALFSACNFGFNNTTPPNQAEQPEDNTGNNFDNTQNEQNEYSQYSRILQTVLTDSYYNEVYDSYASSPNSIRYYTPEIAPIPFGYLKNDGVDIESILKRETECTSVIYIEESQPNNLHFSAMIEGIYNNSYSNISYYTCYTLNYSLTNQELEDLNMLFEGKYIQAPWFVQELTYQKKPVSYTKVKIRKSFYDNTIDRLKTNETITAACGKDLIFDFIDFNVDNRTYDFNIRNTTIALGTLHLKSNFGVEMFGNDIYSQPAVSFSILNKDELPNNYEKITYYNSPVGVTTVIGKTFKK